jgi:hypothetical protein
MCNKMCKRVQRMELHSNQIETQKFDVSIEIRIMELCFFAKVNSPIAFQVVGEFTADTNSTAPRFVLNIY